MIPARILLGSRQLELRLTARARAALEARHAPLDIELELYFSCLLRKRVNFLAVPHQDVASRAVLTDLVSVSFRPVMTQACAVQAVDVPNVEYLPLRRADIFTPRWLALDHHDGRWFGEFGFCEKP